MTQDLAFAGAAGQAAAVRAGEVSAAELTRMVLARIEALNPRINAFSQVLADEALAEAEARDLVPQAERGPLHGVPVAIKQELDVAGTITTFGGRANSTPARADSEVVRRLRQAGAVVVGKTTMPEFGQWPFTESQATGHTHNPWRPTHSTGGSSGGTAAAVAAGMVAAGLGGDGGGSIRIPAACCGLFGLKPSRGRVTSAPHPHLWWSLGTVGPLTRSVLDSALIYDVISGNMPGDLFTAPPPATTFTAAATETPPRLRVGWSTKPVTRGVRPAPEVVRATSDTAELLADLGHDVREVNPRYPDPTVAFTALFYAGVRTEAFAVEHYERLERRTRETVRLGAWVRPPVIQRAIRAGERLAERVDRVFADVDVLLTPTIARLPPELGVLDRGGTVRAAFAALPMIAYTALWNVTGHPGASVPAGFTEDGFPLGVQLVGRRNDEATLFALAAQLETARPWAERTPD